MARTRREHSRIRGECKYPDVTPEQEWTCPGCARDPPRPKGHASHTEEEGCRWHNVRARMAMSRNRAARSGMHPREARIPESESSTADLPGPDINQGIEEELSDTAAKDSTPKQITDEPTMRIPTNLKGPEWPGGGTGKPPKVPPDLNNRESLKRQLVRKSRTGQSSTLDVPFASHALELKRR